jgi:hypothetical protein
MIYPTVNTVVIAIFGLIIGGTLSLQGILWKGEQERVRRQAKTAKEMQESISLANMPPSAFLSMIAVYGLVIVLIVIVKFSFVKMEWAVFFIFFFAGFAILQYLFYLATKGKMGTNWKF